jgi:GDP-L-fucose synthase
VVLWGDGSALREFLHVDDLAEACLLLMEKYDEPGPINIGTGLDLSILQLAETIQRIVGFQGKIIWDTTQPNGTPRKLMEVSKIHALGWKHAIDLEEGIKSVYNEKFLK